MSETDVTTDADGRATAQRDAAESQTGSLPRPRRRAERRPRVSDDAWLWVPGAERTWPRTATIATSSCSPTSGPTSPATPRTLIVRGRDRHRAGAVTKEGQHVSWYQLVRPAATDAIEVPDLDEGDVGDVYVNIAYLRDGRLYRAERRLDGAGHVDRALNVTVTADQARRRSRSEPGVFAVARHRSPRPAGAGAGQPRRHRRSGLRRQGRRHARPVRFFYRREYSRVGTSFSRDYHFTGYSGRDRLQLARRRRRPFTLADFKGDRTAQPQVRKDFPDAIYWVGDLVTDAQGTRPRGRDLSRRADDVAAHRARRHRRHQRAASGRRAHDDHQGSDRPRDHAALPDRRRRGRIPTIVHNYLGRRARDARAGAGDRARAGLRHRERVHAGLASGGERRDDWRYAAPAPGTATLTAATATTETRHATPSSCRSRCCPSACSATHR